MAHNIGKMFYYGEIPWHELGNKVDQPATAEVALEKGGLDWKVELVKIQTAGTPSTPITRRMAVVRTDKDVEDPTRVLGIVHPGFRPMQNCEGIQLLEWLLGEGQNIYHTDGYLGKGEVVWVMARLPGDLTIRGRDIAEPYLLFSNSHDGTRAIDLRLTTVRVVCQNTLNLALSDKKKERIHPQAISFRAVESGSPAGRRFLPFHQKRNFGCRERFSTSGEHAVDSGRVRSISKRSLSSSQRSRAGSQCDCQKEF